jgi:hypothetical protein
MKPSLKLTEQVAADIRAHVKAFDFKSIEKLRKAKDDNGTFDVIISTEDTDRSGEIVKQSGWELKNYKNNPIVLWGHDYYALPIGVCLETYLTEKDGVPALGARGVFLSAEINPYAQQVRKLYEFGLSKGAGVGCTTSVGFIPKEFDENARNTITKAELLEFSFVPIPANQGVGPAQGRALTFDEARTLGLDMVGMRAKGVQFSETLGFIPSESTDNKAPENTAWVKPSLKDFSDKEWTDLTDVEKRAIAAHFAYSPEAIPKAFENLKLPYRRANDSAVVLNGLKCAMRDLVEAVDVEGDRKAVYDHLAAQFKLFGKEVPEFKTLKAAEAGDSCTTDDGSAGVLAADPKDPDGALVCLPQADKSAKDEHGSQKTLLKAVGDEHARHTGEVEKALDAFTEAEGEGEKAAKQTAEHLKDLRSALADEHTMHRAKSIASFRSFDPSEEKAFDKKPHLKALRDEHDQYATKCMKALDDYEEKCTKGVQDDDDSLTGKLEDNQRVHKKAVTKIAKAMCKEAFGEEDQADEKTLEILKEYLAPHIDAQLLPAITGKIGTRIAAEQNAKLGEAHQHLKAATAVLEALHKGLADGSEEEGRSDDAKSVDDGPRDIRSRTRTTSRSEDPALQAHLRAREIMRGIEASAREGLGRLNADIRAQSKK